MAKYKIVNEHFAVHLETIVETNGPGEKPTRRKEVKSFFAGPAFDLSDKDALSHMHKIEPVDEAAQKLFNDFHAEQEAHRKARQPVAVTDSQATDIANAVVAALAQAGLVRGIKA